MTKALAGVGLIGFNVYAMIRPVQRAAHPFDAWKAARLEMRARYDRSRESLNGVMAFVRAKAAEFGNDPYTDKPVFAVEETAASVRACFLEGGEFRIALDAETGKVSFRNTLRNGDVVEGYEADELALAPAVTSQEPDWLLQVGTVGHHIRLLWSAWSTKVFLPTTSL